MRQKTYKVALLSNFTIKGLDTHFKNTAKQYGINIDIYNGEYGQWQQEILGEKLYEFNPDIVYVIVDFEDMDNQINIIDKLAQNSSAKIIVCNQVIDTKSVSGANHQLNDSFKDNTQVLVFDFNSWLSRAGKDEYWNTKYRELGDMRLSPNAFEEFSKELGSYFIPLAGKTKKCLVLDLDNTLWGGIIGEDGLGGIKLSPSGEGAPFYELQKSIKKLKDNGIILAINSSNNESDVKEVFKKHKYMELREDDFAADRINWNNKAQNIQEIASELNIGLDSLVFVDDDPRNRELVNKLLPEVDVIDLPQDASEYVNTLSSYKGFTMFGITEEDQNKAQMYADEKKRRKFKEQAVDLDSFLKGLNINIIIQEAKNDHIPRAAQLTQKTNQFNLTTRRYQEEDIKKFITDRARLWVLDAKDDFGEYGITGLVIATDNNNQWEIDTFLLSCRILGKRIEKEFFSRVLNLLKNSKQQKVTARYLPTQKNEQVKDFYEQFGFTKVSSIHSEDVWECDLNDFEHKPIEFINVAVI